MPELKLYSHTRSLLINRPRGLTLKTIMRDTGIKKRWLDDMISEVPKNQGVNTVELLYSYLTGKTLNL